MYFPSISKWQPEKKGVRWERENSVRKHRRSVDKDEMKGDTMKQEQEQRKPQRGKKQKKHQETSKEREKREEGGSRENKHHRIGKLSASMEAKKGRKGSEREEGEGGKGRCAKVSQVRAAESSVSTYRVLRDAKLDQLLGRVPLSLGFLFRYLTSAQGQVINGQLISLPKGIPRNGMDKSERT